MYKLNKREAHHHHHLHHHGRRKLIILLFLALAVLLLAIVIALVIVFVIDDVPVGVFIPTTEERKLNFTDADDECRKLFGPYGRLLVLDNEDEEAKFIEGYLSQSPEYLKICPSAFIGFRIRFLEKMSRMSSKQIVLPFEFSSLEKKIGLDINEFPCRKTNFSDPNKLIIHAETVNCTSSVTVCILCEIVPKLAYAKDMEYLKRCPASHPICYVVRYAKEGELPFDQLNKMCEEFDGRTALTSNDGLTQGQKLRIGTRSCISQSSVMLLAPSVTVVETINGVEMKYRSKRLEPGTSINNCIVVTTLDKKYPLIYDSCFSKHCYVCQVSKPKDVSPL